MWELQDTEGNYMQSQPLRTHTTEDLGGAAESA